MGYLLDFYGECLQKQREMLHSITTMIFPLSEIGETSASPGRAHDAIKHGETTLKELEER